MRETERSPNDFYVVERKKEGEIKELKCSKFKG